MRTFNRALPALLIIASAALASTSTYTTSFTSKTSLTITGATHNLGCAYFGVRVKDVNGALQAQSFTGVSINDSTYDVTLTWSPAFSGSVMLEGCFNGATSTSTDFEVTIGTNTADLFMCKACTPAAWAGRTVGAHSYVAAGSTLLALIAGHNCSGTAYVYLDPEAGVPTYGLTSAGNCATVSGGATLAYGATGYPTGVVPLGTASYTNDLFTAVSDTRPW